MKKEYSNIDTLEWSQYEEGKNYKRKINLYSQVDKNYRFYDGRQWEGVVANGLPTPVYNVIKRIIDYKISAILSEHFKINYSIEGRAEAEEIAPGISAAIAADILSKYSETTWERLKMEDVLQQVLQDASISGDGIRYYYWNPNIDTGQNLKGDMDSDEIDNINWFPGNVNERDVQKQPYHILAYRMLVSEIIEIGRENKVPEESLMMIKGDTDTQDQAGDYKNHELETKVDGNGKTIALLKMWMDSKTKTIHFKKCVKNLVIQDDTDTGLKRYPLAVMNWYTRKNCCHGEAETTHIIPNQIAINKIAAMIMLSTMHTAFPRFMYDSTRINKPSNQIGAAIEVQGEIESAAKFLTPGSISGDVFALFESTISYTKEMLGANEAALGEVKPENTSAIAFTAKQASIPLENIKRRVYKFTEDTAMIWADIWTTYYKSNPNTGTVRNLKLKVADKEQYSKFDISMLKPFVLSAKIDVGPSSQWSEITSLNTLNHLLELGKIDIVQYAERVPNGIIPKKQELIVAVKKMMEDQKALESKQIEEKTNADQQAVDEQQGADQEQEAKYEQMSQLLEQLPKEVQAKLHQMPPDKMEQAVMPMMQMQPEVLQEAIKQMMEVSENGRK